MTWDEEILRTVNREWAHPWLDPIMVFVSLLGSLLPYALIAWPVWRSGRRFHAIAFLVALVVAEVIVDILKPWIGRLRPDDARRILFVGGEYSMPSGHAARAMAGATALVGLGAPIRWVLFGFAVLTMVSRVYLGAHYPSDVVVGAGVGAASGMIGLLVARFLVRRRPALGTPPPPTAG